MIEIEKRFSLQEVKDRNCWSTLLSEFSDANIYQTWNYAAILSGEKNIKHVAIYEQKELIGLAQVRIRTIPILKIGIAYIYNGPLWQIKNKNNKLESLGNLFNILRQEFVVNQSLMLRIKPFIYSNDFEQININDNIKFKLCDNHYKTILLYLKEDLEKLRSNLKRQWKQNLKKAEKNGLKIVTGSSSDLYNKFISLYNQMQDRKHFKIYVDVNKMGKLNESLEDKFKLKIFLALNDDQPVAGIVGSAIGKTGIALLAATNEAGLKYRAAYILNWELIKWFKESGCNRYDLGGINPERNPGGYQFKSGISDNEVSGLGTFETCDNLVSKAVVNIGELINRK